MKILFIYLHKTWRLFSPLFTPAKTIVSTRGLVLLGSFIYDARECLTLLNPRDRLYHDDTGLMNYT